MLLYLILLRVGFTLPHLLPVARCALTAPFHPYRVRYEPGGIFSAALSVGSRLPGITWHPALWSPDFPPSRLRGTATVRPTLPEIIQATPANSSMSARSDGSHDENNERHRRSCLLNSAVRQRRYPHETGAAMVARGACCSNYWAEAAKAEAATGKCAAAAKSLHADAEDAAWLRASLEPGAAPGPAYILWVLIDKPNCW